MLTTALGGVIPVFWFCHR